jgi:two-component system NtrC family sensor kinase
LILISCIILYQFKTSYYEKVEDHLEELIWKHKQNIDGFLRDKLSDIQTLAKSYTLEEMSHESFLQDRLHILQQSYGRVFVDLGVINAEGIQIAYAGPFKLGRAKYSEAEWFKKALKTEYYKSDVFLGLRGFPHFIIAVKETWKGEEWILRATIDFVAFNNLVQEIRVGETGFAFILNNEGQFQTKPLREIRPDRAPYTEFLGYDEKARDKIHIVERKDDSGNENIYVAAFLKHGDWLLVYQQGASDAFSDFKNALRVALVIILIAGISILTTAFVLSRRIVGLIAQADQEKEMMNEQIVETGKLASVGELASGIAHEINNPVAIMVEEAGWIEDLLEEEEFREGKNLEEFRRALKQINTQGKRCKEITHKLLSFARKTDSIIQDVNINEMMEEIIALSAQRARYANVTIHSDFKTDMPSLRVSQSELQQVFLNLINNALDAMGKDGGRIDIKTRVRGNNVLVGVDDNGQGIAAGNLNRIFDPFYTTKPVGKGTGLGLSICYGIIKKLGGEIKVSSTKGVGTKFRVYIPISGEREKESDGKDSDISEPFD